MKKSKLILLLIVILTTLSCSTNDIENKDNNGFYIGNAYYNTPHVYLNDENTANNRVSDLAIIISNKYLLVDNIESGIDLLYLDFRDVDFKTGEKELFNYRITENASRVNGFIDGGNRLLDDDKSSSLKAIQITFIINSISSTNIDFEFSFTREDGVFIKGNYSGSYTDVSE